jgi:NAD(P)-dependent dehydrogenase (short-subunit alcohol dehydrogenase family)
MRAQNYGRIVMTTSSSGLFGNFGQSNYGAAKMALVGFMQVLSLEGAKNDIRVNCLAPTATTRMTESLLQPEHAALLKPEAVSAGMLSLVAADAPTRAILCAGAGGYERAYVTLTQGVFIPLTTDTPDEVATRFAEISRRDAGEVVPESGAAQTILEISKATKAGSGH